MESEFVAHESNPMPRRGFTTLEATEFLHQHFPQVPQWTCCTDGPAFQTYALRKLIGKGFKTKGTVGSWSWKRVPCAYPTPAYWYGDNTNPDHGNGWVGMIEVQHADGGKFLLFSFLRSTGTVGAVYFASTLDLDLLHAFAEDVFKHFSPTPKNSITIKVYGGECLSLAPEEDERIFLPSELLEDIEFQVLAFFNGTEAYKRLGLRHRRGFLFVGPQYTDGGRTSDAYVASRPRRVRPRAATSVFVGGPAAAEPAEYNVGYPLKEIRRMKCTSAWPG